MARDQFPFFHAMRSQLAQIEQNVLSYPRLSSQVWQELEGQLASLGLAVSTELVKNLKKKAFQKQLSSVAEFIPALHQDLSGMIERSYKIGFDHHGVHILTIHGERHSGKTTTAAKFAYYFNHKGFDVAILSPDLLKQPHIQSLRLPVQQKSLLADWPDENNPEKSTCTFTDAIMQEKWNLLIVDFPGVFSPANHRASHNLENHIMTLETMLLAYRHTFIIFNTELEGTNVTQLRKIVTRGITGVIPVKLDVSLNAGSLFAVSDDLEVPIPFLGVGTQINDIVPFVPHGFIKALFEKS